MDIVIISEAGNGSLHPVTAQLVGRLLLSEGKLA